MKIIVLENSDCGAFLEDTWMESDENIRFKIASISKKEYLLTSECSRFLTKNIWKRRTNHYYKITAANGKCLKATGMQSILTDTGWKRIKNLRVGDELMCYDFFEGRQFYKLVSLEEVEGEELFVYNISLGDRTLIANGFICSDYDMQQKK